MTDARLHIEDAPARSRPAWLTGRTACLFALAIAAVLAGWVVGPRVVERGQLVGVQHALLEYRPDDEAVVAVANGFCGVFETDRYPELESYSRAALPATIHNAAFVGGRDAGRGERLVSVQADPVVPVAGGTPELSLRAWVVEPGGWIRAARVLTQTAVGPNALPVPPPTGRTVAVIAGNRHANDPSAFSLNLLFEGGHANLSINASLMPDDTIRFDWPTQWEARAAADVAESAAD